jgi:hypothetical protein
MYGTMHIKFRFSLFWNGYFTERRKNHLALEATR